MPQPRIPNETADLLQRLPAMDKRRLPDRNWYRFWRAVYDVLFGLNGILKLFVFSAYGVETYSGPFPNLGATYQTLVFDTIPLTPRGVTFDLVENTLSVEYPGVYSFDFSGALIHRKDNVLETTNIRAYDVTIGAPGNPFPITLQAQSTVTNISRSFLIELEPGDEYRLEIGGGDVVTNVSFSGLLLRIFNVGEWRGPPFG